MRNCRILQSGPAVLLLATLVACTEPRPELPIEGSTELVPVPAEFVGYARDVEACSGHPVPAGVTFFVYSGRWFVVDGRPVVAAYQYVARRVTLGSEAVKDPRDVRHELLHAALGERYAVEDEAAAHPVAYFGEPGATDPAKLGKCGAIVSH